MASREKASRRSHIRVRKCDVENIFVKPEDTLTMVDVVDDGKDSIKCTIYIMYLIPSRFVSMFLQYLVNFSVATALVP